MWELYMLYELFTHYLFLLMLQRYSGYVSFALNLWLSSRISHARQGQGSDPFLFVALDAQAEHVRSTSTMGREHRLICYKALALAGAPVWSCQHPELSFSPDAAHHASRPFIDIMHIRLRVAAQALNAGYNVLLSDADAVFTSPVSLRRQWQTWEQWHACPHFRARSIFSETFL